MTTENSRRFIDVARDIQWWGQANNPTLEAGARRDLIALLNLVGVRRFIAWYRPILGFTWMTKRTNALVELDSLAREGEGECTCTNPFVTCPACRATARRVYGGEG